MELKEIHLNLGQMAAENKPEAVLTCLRLGSCVALCVYDPVAKIGGMAHMVLPEHREGVSDEQRARFVDWAPPMLVGSMEKIGAIKTRLKVKLVGGAAVTASSGNPLLDLGKRNIDAATEILGKMGLPIRAADIGGTQGRSVRLYVETGKLVVSRLKGDIVEL